MQDSEISLTEAEYSELTNTKSENEWNAACDKVKRARGGAYPHDWFKRMLMSGVAARTQKNWR